MQFTKWLHEKSDNSDNNELVESDTITNEEEQLGEINVLVLTSRNEKDKNGNRFKTAESIKKYCDSKKIENYTAFIENCYLTLDNNVYKIYNEEDKDGFIVEKGKTVVIVRGSIMQSKAALDLLSQLEEKVGLFCVNTRKCIETCSDKYNTIVKLTSSGIPCPKTYLIRDEESIDSSLKNVGGKFPVILKTLSGSKGIGVFFADSYRALKSILQVIWKINDETEILIQEYIETKFDVRVHVLGDEIIGVMRRDVIPNDFRSNFSLGGEVSKIELSDEIKELCIKASKAVSATWAGVDLIIKNDKPYFIEVNSSPGTTGIEKAIKKNISKIVIDFVSDKKNWMISKKISGYREIIDVVGIGELVAKFDTGNSTKFCTIHSDEYSISKDKKTIIWKFNDKKIKSKLNEIVKINVRGMRNYTEERPAINLDFKFDGTLYKNVDFVIDDRDGRSPILLNREIMDKMNVCVNPSNKYLLTIPKDKR